MNWRRRPLTSHEVIIETIGAVKTKTGLRVQAALDTDTYPKGIRISDKAMKAFEAETPPATPVPWRLELHDHRRAHSTTRHTRTTPSK